MRIIRLLFWALVAIALVVLGLANRGIVRLRVLPEALGEAAGVSPDLDLPLFLVILAGVALGLLVGFVWEWLREWNERVEARATARELDRLRAEVARLRAGATVPAAPGTGGPAVGRPDLIAQIDAPLLVRR